MLGSRRATGMDPQTADRVERASGVLRGGAFYFSRHSRKSRAPLHPGDVSDRDCLRGGRADSNPTGLDYVHYLSGESLIRKRVRTCSESSSMALRLAIGSVCARYFRASTRTRWPST